MRPTIVASLLVATGIIILVAVNILVWLLAFRTRKYDCSLEKLEAGLSPYEQETANSILASNVETSTQGVEVEQENPNSSIASNVGSSTVAQVQQTALLLGGTPATDYQTGYQSGYRIVFDPHNQSLMIGPEANLKNEAVSVSTSNSKLGIIGHIDNAANKIVIQVFNKTTEDLGDEQYLDYGNYDSDQMGLSDESLMVLSAPQSGQCQAAALVYPNGLDLKEMKQFASCRYSTGCLVSTAVGDVYRIGGKNLNYQELQVSEKFDVETGAFANISSILPGIQGDHGCTGVEHEGDIVICTNDTSVIEIKCVIYNPETDVWEQVGSLINDRSGYGLASIGGSLYAMLGRTGNQSISIERYDEDTKTWSNFEFTHNLGGYLHSFATFTLP